MPIASRSSFLLLAELPWCDPGAAVLCSPRPETRGGQARPGVSSLFSLAQKASSPQTPTQPMFSIRGSEEGLWPGAARWGHQARSPENRHLSARVPPPSSLGKSASLVPPVFLEGRHEYVCHTAFSVTLGRTSSTTHYCWVGGVRGSHLSLLGPHLGPEPSILLDLSSSPAPPDAAGGQGSSPRCSPSDGRRGSVPGHLVND